MGIILAVHFKTVKNAPLNLKEKVYFIDTVRKTAARKRATAQLKYDLILTSVAYKCDVGYLFEKYDVVGATFTEIKVLNT